MRAVVTGAAGFIGSHLCDRLLADGHEVVGVDCFRDRYPSALKERNLASARKSQRFALRRTDLVTESLAEVVDGADVIFHLAGRPGLDLPTGGEFAEFNADNVVATQRLLEAVVAKPVRRFVYASSSSVYGEAERLPTKESAVPMPVSAYGVTKLAGEHLARVFGTNLGVPVTVLRYFTVYGPRQRPDMAIARFIAALAAGHEVEV
ncbi:MAG TPA: NAD-dependent epimerase/dehydratase family protein, partial [Candidatus Dormibacteraeota bacterium]|nr:NAD-dependent epimerase/dehydratase family protein [Candidatus Dormibacteraeota bacterium]